MSSATETTKALNRWSGTKASTFENMEAGEELGPIDITVDEGLIKQYAFAMDDYRPWHFAESPFGGPIAHSALLANDLLTIYYTNYDRTTVNGLHTEEELWFYRPVPVGETVRITGRFIDKYVRRGNGYVAMEAEACDQQGNVLVRHRGAEIMRVENAGELVGRGAATPAGPQIVPEVSEATPVDRSNRGLSVGTPVASLRKYLSQEQVSVYSFVGEHERNFHNDLELARKNGMDRTIAQGLQTAGYFSDLCTGFFGEDWFTSGWIKAKFLKPVYPESALTIQGKIAGQEDVADGYKTNLELWTRDHEDRLVSVAWASGVTRDGS